MPEVRNKALRASK